MKVQIIEKGGHPEFAVLPFADYEAIIQRLDDLEDARDLREYRVHPEESFPKRWWSGSCRENPSNSGGNTGDDPGCPGKGKGQRLPYQPDRNRQKDCSVILKALAKALNVDMEPLITSEES